MSKLHIIKKTLVETALLNRYLKSRGINPEFVSKDQKVAHSKTNQFKVWMNSHINDTIREGVDKKDTITFDIPLLIRVLEFAREELKSDVNLHKMVERLIAIRGKGTLTMNQYGRIIKEEFQHLSEEQIDEISKELANRYMYSAKSDRAETDAKINKAIEKQGEKWSSRRHKSISKMFAKGEKRTTGIGRALDRLTKEEAEQLDELSPALQHSYFKKAYAQKNDKTVPKATRRKRDVGMNKVINRTLRRNTISTPGASQDFKDQESKRGIGHVRDHVEVEGTVVESKEANYGGDYQTTVLRVKELAKKKPVDMKSLAARMQASYAKDEKKLVKQESLEPMAACNQPGDGANTPDDTVVKSTTAKKVKLLLGNKKRVSEEMYDHEKEDKSVAGLKRPKVLKLAMDATTRETPQAAAVLQGGKTLTGETRDTIEIDPMMKMRKQPKDSQKSV